MTPPPCDKHKNLQMVPFRLESPTGQTFVHACPVPSCGRQHDDQGYFEMVEGQLLRGKNAAPRFSAKDKIVMATRARAGTAPAV
jgi:hypothetical protein